MRKLKRLLAFLLAVYVLVLVGCAALQRKFLFYPTHHNSSNGLSAWRKEERIIGYAREVAAPQNVWLVLHGNAGQASDRAYALASFSTNDSVFILEYPGYGAREGKPSRASFDAAAAEAYQFLRKNFPKTPVCLMGESIGTGPASALANQSPPPDKIALVVPFDKLTRVAAHHFPFLPVSLLLEANWDNVRSLSRYNGQVEIFAAADDTVIPISRAKALAGNIPAAKFHTIDGGHNEWSSPGRVQIRNP